MLLAENPDQRGLREAPSPQVPSSANAIHLLCRTRSAVRVANQSRMRAVRGEVFQHAIGGSALAPALTRIPSGTLRLQQAAVAGISMRLAACVALRGTQDPGDQQSNPPGQQFRLRAGISAQS